MKRLLTLPDVKVRDSLEEMSIYGHFSRQRPTFRAVRRFLEINIPMMMGYAITNPSYKLDAIASSPKRCAIALLPSKERSPPLQDAPII
ncbi:MAG: hypothetical protein AAGD25_16605 [Cyanobacteria bacterium P01_F01_bin.150]